MQSYLHVKYLKIMAFLLESTNSPFKNNVDNDNEFSKQIRSKKTIITKRRSPRLYSLLMILFSSRFNNNINEYSDSYLCLSYKVREAFCEFFCLWVNFRVCIGTSACHLSLSIVCSSSDLGLFLSLKISSAYCCTLRNGKVQLYRAFLPSGNGQMYYGHF